MLRDCKPCPFTGSAFLSAEPFIAAGKADAVPVGSDQEPTQAHRIAEPGDLSRALDACQRRLVVACQKGADLRLRYSLLAEQVESLEVALVKANQFANFDELTGLPNRRLLRDRLTRAFALAKRHDQGLALLFLDIDDFKSVNDELGHAAGDRVLQQFGLRLSNSLRTADTACRYGGDEFVALLTELEHRDDATIALQKIRAQLAPPFMIGRHSIQLTMSDGVATYPEDGCNFSDLMQVSDRLMFSKKTGSRRCTADSSASNISVHA
jgi:diguanylate cyclase (GGDEF)-like protein